MVIPSFTFSCSNMKSLCPCSPQMMGNHGLPGETGLSWEPGTGKASLSGQENWPVRRVDKHLIPLAGLQLLLGVARQKCLFKLIEEGKFRHLGASSESCEVDTQAEMLKLSLHAYVCLPFPKVNGTHRCFFPLFFGEFSQVSLILCEEGMTTPPCLIGGPQLTCNEFFLIAFQLFSFLLRASARYSLSKIITALFLNVPVQSNSWGVEWLGCLEIMSDSPRKV